MTFYSVVPAVVWEGAGAGDVGVGGGHTEPERFFRFYYWLLFPFPLLLFDDVRGW